jgi:hypothetical protein
MAAAPAKEVAIIPKSAAREIPTKVLACSVSIIYTLITNLLPKA